MAHRQLLALPPTAISTYQANCSLPDAFQAIQDIHMPRVNVSQLVISVQNNKQIKQNKIQLVHFGFLNVYYEIHTYIYTYDSYI